MSNERPDAAAIERHYQFLRERIYQVRTKWPHFERLLEDVRELAANARDGQTIVCMERAYVYGGLSLFAPLFGRGRFVTVDIHNEASTRGAYQKSWTDHPDCIRVAPDHSSTITATPLESASADVLIVPNVVHHVRDQDAMFAELARVLRPGGIGYIFEALLRELHQEPDDYVRHTPWGFETHLARHGLEMTSWRAAGGPFEAITYCWIQALQYLPEAERRDREAWFYERHFRELLELDRLHTRNLERQHTSFPVAYGIYFTRRG